jgi:hypothetical protein
LRRWTLAATPATDPVWLAALERAQTIAGAPDNLRLLVADKVPGPLGWGFRKPVIMIDVDTYAEREEADAIMAHEVAHVARADWPALIATRLATALFWFNPLVWALAREQVQQAEEAADAHAAHVVDPTRYAETLLSWAQIGRGIAVPANSIAPARGLTRRVEAVLEPRLRERSAGSRVAVMAMLVCVGLAAPVSAVELVEATRPEPAPQAPLAAPALAEAEVAVAPVAPRARSATATVRRVPAAPRASAPRPAPAEAKIAEAAEMVEMIGPAVEAVRLVVPQVPVIVAAALDRVDPVKLAHAISDSQGVRVVPADLREAFTHARAERPHLLLVEAQVRRELTEDGAPHGHLRSGMARGAHGMMRGAEGMERGAATMEEQARRFRDSEERERIIARERARGKDVTHEDLIEAADQMEDGAREMRRGAREMRRSAQAMMTH